MQAMQATKLREPLEELVRRIEAHAKSADEQVLKAAALVAEVRQRIEAGEGEGLKWLEWARKHIKLSHSRLYELHSIAEADDPAKELERIRKQGCERVKRYRKKKADERAASEAINLESERERLIAWAKEAPLDRVGQILAQIVGHTIVPRSNDEALGAESRHAA